MSKKIDVIKNMKQNENLMVAYANAGDLAAYRQAKSRHEYFKDFFNQGIYFIEMKGDNSHGQKNSN